MATEPKTMPLTFDGRVVGYATLHDNGEVDGVITDPATAKRISSGMVTDLSIDTNPHCNGACRLGYTTGVHGLRETILKANPACPLHGEPPL